MKIAVIHHSLDLLGGGERVCMSLLDALDRTRHETVLRCAVPPPGVQFAGSYDDGDNDGDDGPPPAAAAAAATAAAAGYRPRPPFNRVRLARTSSRGGGEAAPGHGAASPGFGAEVAALFRRTACDVAVVTDGGFVMQKTDAPRVVWYCNSALGHETRMLSLPRPRHPRRILRLWRDGRPIRGRIAAAAAEKVDVVPNSEHTRRAVSAAIGRPVPGTAVVYPPVDVRRFAALRGAPRERRTATVARFAPEKNLGGAVRIMLEAGGQYDIVGNARGPAQLRTLEEARRSLTAGMRLHANAAHGVLEEIVGGARAYLHASEETFGVSVAEAAAAGCVPVVPDHTAHPETVPFAELRYRTEAEAAEIVRGALDGRYDGLLPALQEHVQRFSEEAFQEAMIGIIEGRR